MKPDNLNKKSSGSRRAAKVTSDLVTSDSVASNLPVLDDGTLDVKVIKSNLRQSDRHPSREQLITEAAYHRAEARDFESGHALEDWLAAEAEVDARLCGEGRAY